MVEKLKRTHKTEQS